MIPHTPPRLPKMWELLPINHDRLIGKAHAKRYSTPYYNHWLNTWLKGIISVFLVRVIRIPGWNMHPFVSVRMWSGEDVWMCVSAWENICFDVTQLMTTQVNLCLYSIVYSDGRFWYISRPTSPFTTISIIRFLLLRSTPDFSTNNFHLHLLILRLVVLSSLFLPTNLCPLIRYDLIVLTRIGSISKLLLV